MKIFTNIKKQIEKIFYKKNNFTKNFYRKELLKLSIRKNSRKFSIKLKFIKFSMKIKF